MKIGGANVRGYDLEQFSDAFDRYLPPPAEAPLPRYPATAEREGSRVASQEPVAGETTGSGNGSDNGHAYHTCHGCHAPIFDLADGFFDGKNATFWHRSHWDEHLTEVPA